MYTCKNWYHRYFCFSGKYSISVFNIVCLLLHCADSSIMASIKFAMLVPLKGSNGSIFCGCCPQNVVYSHLHQNSSISSLNMVQNCLLVAINTCKACERVQWDLFTEFYIKMARRSRRCVRSRRPMVLWACSEFKPSISLYLVVVFLVYIIIWKKHNVIFNSLLFQKVTPTPSIHYLSGFEAQLLISTRFGSDCTNSKGTQYLYKLCVK